MSKFTTEYFIEKARKVHNNKYDYSKVEYKKSKEKICIICPEHGEFWQTPSCHLRGNGCPKCASNTLMTKGEFIKKAIEIHGNKYAYDLVDYNGNKTKVDIICKKHGVFKQRPNEHLSGCGCPKCANKIVSDKLKKSNDYFIKKAKEIHNNRYDYTKVNYINARTDVIITCPIHGDFLQKPNYHLNGNGCPKCNFSKLEEKIHNILKKKNIEFAYQYRNKELFGKQSLDFYLPEYNVAIECQGRQHFEPVDFAGKGKNWAYNEFIKTRKRDSKKLDICERNSISLFYFDGEIFKKADNNETISFETIIK